VHYSDAIPKAGQIVRIGTDHRQEHEFTTKDNKMGHAAEFTEQAFDTDVLQSDQPVLVDFWATWCGPCRQIAPLIEELAVKYDGSVRVGKVNVEDHPELAQRYGINAIPTLLLFKAGEIVDRFQGIPPRTKLEAALDSAQQA
jgi:thioredoxin 1